MILPKLLKFPRSAFCQQLANIILHSFSCLLQCKHAYDILLNISCCCHANSSEKIDISNVMHDVCDKNMCHLKYLCLIYSWLEISRNGAIKFTIIQYNFEY